MGWTSAECGLSCSLDSDRQARPAARTHGTYTRHVHTARTHGEAQGEHPIEPDPHTPPTPTPAPAPAITPLVTALLDAWPLQAQDLAVSCVDPSGYILWASEGSRQVLGYDGSELVGSHISVLFTPEDKARGLPEHELVVARSVGHSDDDRWHLRKDGSRAWTGGLVTAVRDAAGECIGFVKIMRDRTSLAARIRTLENRISALRRAENRRPRFLATVTHELANPLAPLATALHLLSKSAAKPKQAELLAVAQRQLEVMRRLVEDMRRAVEFDEPGMPLLVLAPVQLQELLREVTAACEPKAAQRGLSLSLLAPEVPIRLQADAARLHQVVMNLLTNAIKYTPAGGRIWVEATVEGTAAVIRVHDTGVGIEADVLPRIFDLFTQEIRSQHLSQGGWGVGLAVVRQLVEAHGGTVEVSSEGLGKGSDFTVRLPLEPDGQTVQAATPPG